MTEINATDHPFINFDDSFAVSTDLIITVVTNDPVYYTNTDVTYYIKATLDDYIILYPNEAPHWEPFIV